MRFNAVHWMGTSHRVGSHPGTIHGTNKLNAARQSGLVQCHSMPLWTHPSSSASHSAKNSVTQSSCIFTPILSHMPGSIWRHLFSSCSTSLLSGSDSVYDAHGGIEADGKDASTGNGLTLGLFTTIPQYHCLLIVKSPITLEWYVSWYLSLKYYLWTAAT